MYPRPHSGKSSFLLYKPCRYRFPNAHRNHHVATGSLAHDLLFGGPICWWKANRPEAWVRLVKFESGGVTSVGCAINTNDTTTHFLARLRVYERDFITWGSGRLVVSAERLRFHLAWGDQCPAELCPVLGLGFSQQLLIHPTLRRFAILAAPEAANGLPVANLRDRQL
jgi:hypothetical protein